MLDRPSNVYMYVQRLAMSNKAHFEPMSYGIEKTVEKLQLAVNEYQSDLEEMSEIILNQQKDLQAMRTQLKKAQSEIASSRRELADVTNKLQNVRDQRDSARRKAHKMEERIEAAYDDTAHYEDMLLSENEDLSELIDHLKKEVNTLSCTNVTLSSDICQGRASFSFQTKDGGKVYTAAVRELYYALLANQLPPAKIASIIRTILKSFLPWLQVDKLQLPGESCAAYMRREELTTLNLAHKATRLTEQAQTGCVNFNSDGTTKAQRKIQGAAINDMVLSVNEVPDGCADTLIADISQELQKLREIAHALGLPNADKINWTLIQSSTSDSASTQKKFNKILEDKRKEDLQKYGPACSEGIELVQNFCCMHLGVNLRKAFLDGIKANSSDTIRHDNPQADVFVHEFCKLLGQHGVPEYGLGSLAFPDFLQLCVHSEKKVYYEQCLKIRLQRQVGNRYFVTAANATKILFLCEAATDFLVYSGKDKGNKLECSVFQKLQDPVELAHLTADAIMFHHVYSNLVMLAKSTTLNKSVLDMNQHYLELKLFLQEIERDPEIAMNPDYMVFKSESRLYGTDKEVNHRLHNMYKCTEQKVFTELPDKTTVYSLLVVGASAMHEKLSVYAQNQLPDGVYWNPDPEVKAILKSLRPNNDVCEGILGLNDYLTTALPNMHQMSRSNLIQAKKNRTIHWLGQLPSDKRSDIVTLARKRRVEVAKSSREAEVERSKMRREKMMREKCRRDALEERAIREKEYLSNLDLISSCEDLKTILSEIENENISSTKKAQKRRKVIREQIDIRKKVLSEKINIPFSKNRKQRPVSEIVKDFMQYLNEHSSQLSSETSDTLVGKKILHRFETDGKEQWYAGVVVSYNAVSKLYEIAYDNEDDHCFFNLSEDISQGDLIVNDDVE